jgi:hypothetical protein
MSTGPASDRFLEAREPDPEGSVALHHLTGGLKTWLEAARRESDTAADARVLADYGQACPPSIHGVISATNA